MQVFIPVANVSQSLRLLDKRRLGKQRVEAKQLIDTILNRPMSNGKPRKGWYNHPAAVMCREYLPFLIYYYNQSLTIFAERGGNNNKLKYEPQVGELRLPWWWDNDDVHASHRGRLLFKGKLDVLADRIKKFTNERGANNWLKRRGLPELNVCRQEEWQRATDILDSLDADDSLLDNYYLQHGWTESDQLEYMWPGQYESDGLRRVR